MKKIICQIMRNKIIELIKILGIGINEIVMEINLDCGNFESIEYIPEEDLILLHIFKEDDFDITFDYDELEEEDQLKVYQSLSFFYN
jgi:hypothetical protein